MCGRITKKSRAHAISVTAPRNTFELFPRIAFHNSVEACMATFVYPLGCHRASLNPRLIIEVASEDCDGGELSRAKIMQILDAPHLAVRAAIITICQHHVLAVRFDRIEAA